MLKNRFFILAIAIAVVAVGVAAFAPSMGMDSIAFAQSGSAGAGEEGVVEGGGTNPALTGNASAAQLAQALINDDQISASNLVGFTVTTAGQDTRVFLNNVPLCWGPQPSQCSPITATGDFKVVGSIQETGALIIIHAGKLRFVFV
jgi:hypothetical protein